MIRGQVSDPAAAKTTLAKLATDPKAFSGGPVTIRHAPGGFYVFKEAAHTTTAGVVGDHLLIGVNASPPQLTAFAAAPSPPASGAQGSVAFKVGLPALLGLALKQAQNPTVQTLLRSLGDLTGWLAAAPEALTGSATGAGDQVSRLSSSSAPRLDSGSLRLPHFGDCKHDGSRRWTGTRRSAAGRR